MIAVNLLGCLFYVLILVGTGLVGQRKWQGWALRFVGNLGWLHLGIYLGLWSVVIFETIFIIIDARACRRWRRSAK